MAFTQEPTKTPEGIGRIIVRLRDLPDGTHTADFVVMVEMSDGTLVRRTGDLVPHITPAQRTALMDFMTGLRAQAETQIIGP